MEKKWKEYEIDIELHTSVLEHLFLLCEKKCLP